MENKIAIMRKKSTVAAKVDDTLAEVYAGLSREDVKTVSDRIEAAAFGECQICYQDSCGGVLVAREVDHINRRGMFTVFGLCEDCQNEEVGEIETCLMEKGYGQPEIYWFNRKPAN